MDAAIVPAFTAWGVLTPPCVLPAAPPGKICPSFRWSLRITEASFRIPEPSNLTGREIRERAFFTVILPHPDRKAPPRKTMNSSAMFSQKKLPLTHWSRLISPCSWTISILTAGRAWAINTLMKCLNSFMDQEPFRHWEFTEFQQMKWTLRHRFCWTNRNTRRPEAIPPVFW